MTTIGAKLAREIYFIPNFSEMNGDGDGNRIILDDPHQKFYCAIN